MRAQDFCNQVEERFQAYLPKMQRSEFMLAEKGDERIRMIVYTSDGAGNFPLQPNRAPAYNEGRRSCSSDATGASRMSYFKA